MPHHYSWSLPTAVFLCGMLTACVGDSNSENPQGNTQNASATAAPQPPSDEGDSGGITNRGEQAASGSEKWWSALPREAWSEFEQVPTRNPWFEVFKIQERIYAIYEPGQFEEVISYLITGREQALLFDTGLGIGDIHSVAKQLTALPITVLNSHTHYDHVGGNHQFETVIGRNHPYPRERSKGLSNEEIGEYARGDWIWKPTPPGFSAEAYATNGWEYSRWVQENQFIDLGGVSLEVIYSPGHSPDSLVLVDHQRRLMFTGDTFYLAPLYTHIEGSSFADYAASAEKLAGLSGVVDRLLMSHNTPKASSSYLERLHAAFTSISNGDAPYTLSADGREYRFGEFSILTSDPPLPGEGTIETP
jgi:glyoxylase-like metal-dependent hydrolase (beta-lactamase superfamily II)